MAETLYVKDILNLCEELWVLPTELTQLLTQFSRKLILTLGHPILPLLHCLKKLMNSVFENPVQTNSWTQYSELASDDAYATICFPSETVMKVFAYLQTCVSDDTTDNCSLSPSMANPLNGNTSTSSTIAVGPPGTCRCTTFAGLPFKRRLRAQWTGGTGRGYFRALGIYIFLHPRECLHYYFTGARREVPSAAEIDSDGRREEGPQGTTVDETIEISSVCDDTLDGSLVPSSSGTSNRRQTRNITKSTAQKNKTLETILAFFEKFPVCPLLSTCKTAQWCEHDILRGIGRTAFVYQQAIDTFQSTICNKSIPELIEFYLNSQPMFACTSGHVFDFYYTVEESRAKLYDLLQYQCNYDEEFITYFLQVVYNILDRQEEKKNCMQIKGPSNAGKTLFSKLCASLCLVKGQIANFNKYNQFPLQDCVDKRILIWDEPNCEPCSFDTCKMLFAGDPCMANIKYQSHVQIDRTPVLVTTNIEVFPNDAIFTNRMYKFTWHTAPLLQAYKKHIHPLGLYELWKQYKIIHTVSQSVSVDPLELVAVEERVIK